MSDHTTPDQPGSVPIVPNETFHVRGPLPDGWTILYNDAATALLAEHSAVVRCYLALCVMSNGARTCHPSLDTLGDAMGGMSRDSAKRAVKRLQDIGLLHVERPVKQGRGMASIYTLSQPPKKGGTHAPLPGKGGHPCTPSQPKGGQEAPQKGGTGYAPLTNNPTGNKKNNTPHVRAQARAREEPQARPSGAGDQEQGTDQGGTNQTEPVSKLNGTSKEAGHPYWTDPEQGAHRLGCFGEVFAVYPRDDGEASAMAAWRQVIGTRLDQGGDGDLAGVIWRAVNWYAAKMRKERQEPRFIPSFANWIRQEAWNDAPATIRAGKAA